MWGMKRMAHQIRFGLVLAGSLGMSWAGTKSPDLPWVQLKDGRLFYSEDPAHNRIPDFSTAGYEEGEAPIPDVPVKVRVDADVVAVNVKLLGGPQATFVCGTANVPRAEPSLAVTVAVICTVPGAPALPTFPTLNDTA